MDQYRVVGVELGFGYMELRWRRAFVMCHVLIQFTTPPFIFFWRFLIRGDEIGPNLSELARSLNWLLFLQTYLEGEVASFDIPNMSPSNQFLSNSLGLL
mmetsp:Transcript_8760/g.17582  ORF Transcript_8760/g.17582 Transcript_8760/m.17582 type:complete len:99 (-) Transcript_8760:2017-2313(-)